jgi:CHASE2 domain-containing sensor protein
LRYLTQLENILYGSCVRMTMAPERDQRIVILRIDEKSLGRTWRASFSN